MLIRTAGLFWKREDVFWGRQKSSGKLLGIQSDSKKEDPVDFWKQAGIYALYANYNLVYVGQAGSGAQRLGVRLRQHLYNDLAGRWDLFSWFGVGYVKKGDCTLTDPPKVKQAELSELLDHLEGISIAIAEPKLNRQGASFGPSVERYLQVRDERLGLSDRQLLEAVAARQDTVLVGKSMPKNDGDSE